MGSIWETIKFPDNNKQRRTWYTTIITLLLAISTLFELIPYIRDSHDGNPDDSGKLNVAYSYARMVCFILLTALIFLPYLPYFNNKGEFGDIKVTGVEKVFGVLSGYYIIFYALLIGFY